MKILSILLALNLFIRITCYAQRSPDGVITINASDQNPYGEKMKPFSFFPDSLLPIDFKQDLRQKTISELRILRNSIYARNGQLFKESELRSFFAAKYNWYDTLTTEIWLRIGDTIVYEPVLTHQEYSFIKKIDSKIAEKIKNNFSKQGNQLANIDHIVNLNEFQKLTPEFSEKLKQNNFVIIPESYPQLFHIYEQNDYSEIPCFVTSDLYLQVLHMYFSYLVRSLEKDKYIPMVTRITKELSKEAASIAQSTSNPQIKELAEYNQVYFAVPYQLLTRKALPIPGKYKEAVKTDLKHILSASTANSKLVPDYMFSLFKPRGHYSRNDTSKNYFRAMIWLQTVPFCREKDEPLKQAIFMAYLLNNSSKTVKDYYRSLYETISFLVGEPDNLSISDISDILTDLNISDISKIMDERIVSDIRSKLAEIIKNKNRIKPKILLTCPDKINFLPQRYVFDNEIISEMVDVKINADRAFPRALDVFAALGNKTAEDILLHTYNDNQKWEDFSSSLSKMKKQFNGFNKWDRSVYNKWFECLNALQLPIKKGPYFMQTNAWERKTLNTSLASYAELKHDAILYAEQPNAAEMGGGPMPPDPIVKGYVEPNKIFWKKAIEMVTLSDSIIKKHGLSTDDLNDVSKELMSQLEFMLKTTEKELNNLLLSDEEYKFIQKIGGHVDNLTLSILEPGKRPSNWYEVLSPDTCISVVADIYNRNVPYCPKNGVLYEGVGPVHSIYAVVEMGGYLYLTRGAVFNHYEFVVPDEKRLTDEDWQIKVVKKDLPETNIWMNDLILAPQYKPKEDDTQYYMPTL
jgi:hypothetical protein